MYPTIKVLHIMFWLVVHGMDWGGGGLERGQEVKVYPIIGQSIDVLAMASVVCYYHLYM